MKGGKKKGWSELNNGAVIAYRLFASGPHARELGIGLVDSNARDGQSVQIQPCRAVWVGAGLAFKPIYACRDELTTDPQRGHPEERTVPYSGIVLQFQLHQGGTLFHSDASQITERGWGLFREKGRSSRNCRLLPCSWRGSCPR